MVSKYPETKVFLRAGLAAVAAISLFLSGCAKPSPVKTVQLYLQMLSGERPVNERLIAQITTESFRSSYHAHVVSFAESGREWALESVTEARKNPAIRRFFELITWTTAYEAAFPAPDTARVVARVILTEKRTGDRDRALAIEGLPRELVDILRRGLELPFQFELKLEDGRWRIDNFYFPEALLPVFDSLGVRVGGN